MYLEKVWHLKWLLDSLVGDQGNHACVLVSVLVGCLLLAECEVAWLVMAHRVTLWGALHPHLQEIMCPCLGLPK
jgi:hypothetical protein